MVWVLVAVVSASSMLSDLFQSAGMKEHGAIETFRPAGISCHFKRLIRNKKLLASVACLAVSFFAFIALLSCAELSFAVPATAITYVLETILAAGILKERVDWRRYAGATLVSGGVALLAL